jgi:hypothetical protein
MLDTPNRAERCRDLAEECRRRAAKCIDLACDFLSRTVDKPADNRTSQCSATATGASSASTLFCGIGKSVVIGPGAGCMRRQGQRLR